MVTIAELPELVSQILAAQPITDMHTHLYPPTFGSNDSKALMLWGIDDLVTYHYLVAEVFRVVPATKLPYADFWGMTKSERADHIWKHLFVERTPISEACRGVVTTLSKLGLDPGVKTLTSHRQWFEAQNPNDYIDRVMQLSNVKSITMTNAVFDDDERNCWLAGIAPDPRFAGVLRFDPLLLDWPIAGKKLANWGYAVSTEFSDSCIMEVKRFLNEWCDRVNAIYCAASLPPEFRGSEILEKAVLPVCEDRNIPFAMMIGSRRGVNSELRDAADMGGLASVEAVTSLCQRFPKNRFFATMLARENQHELAVAARKFGNLMVFGCWWFLNNPSLVEEITRMRLELLGTSFIPQHSDARVLDQLIYKWDHSRAAIGRVLTVKYGDLIDAGWPLTRGEIARDAAGFLEGNFGSFLRG